MELKFRNLNADEIEVRVGNVAKDKKWISLLLFQNSRVAMDLLDETVGKENWKREHSRDNKNCTISIWSEEKQQWVGKEDTGVESFSDKEKGLASDSFKRAAVNWGIGRALYSAPKIYLYGNSEELKNNKYFVKDIDYDKNDRINKLTIIDSKENVVYTYPKIIKQVNSEKPKLISKAQRERIFALGKRNNEVIKNVLARYGYEKTETIKTEDYDKICTEIEAEVNM